MATEHLLTVHSGFQSHVGEEGLGHRRQQRNLRLGPLPCRFVVAELGDIELQRDVAGKRTPTFVQGLHGQQHAPHIGMHDDRIGGLVLRHRASRGTALMRSRAYSMALW